MSNIAERAGFIFNGEAFVLNITHLRSFLAIVDTASFTKAAEGLFTTQSTLSRHVSSLEEELGVQLLERDRHHHIKLTPAGRLLTDEGRRWLAEMISIEHRVTGVGAAADSHLDIICSPMYSQILRNVFLRFREEYPHIICNVRQIEAGKEFQTIQNNNADIGVLFFKSDSDIGDQFEMQQISTEKMCLVCGSGDPIAKKGPLSLKDFRNETLVISKYPTNDWITGIHRSIEEYFGRVIYVDNLEMVILNISANQGIAIWPEIIVRNTQSYSRILDVSEFQSEADLVSVWSKQNKNSNIQKFSALCRYI